MIVKTSKERNEVIVYGRNIFMGYYNNMEATKEVIDSDVNVYDIF